MSSPDPSAKLHLEKHQGQDFAACSTEYHTIAWRSVLGSLCAILLLSACRPAFAKSDTVPDWVRAAAAQKLPAYPPETKAVVLLEDITYTVAPDGRAVEHVRRVVKSSGQRSSCYSMTFTGQRKKCLRPKTRNLLY